MPIRIMLPLALGSESTAIKPNVPTYSRHVCQTYAPVYFALFNVVVHSLQLHANIHIILCNLVIRFFQMAHCEMTTAIRKLQMVMDDTTWSLAVTETYQRADNTPRKTSMHMRMHARRPRMHERTQDGHAHTRHHRKKSTCERTHAESKTVSFII